MKLYPPAPLRSSDGGIGFSLVGLVLVGIVPLLVFGSGVAWLIVDQKKSAVASELASTAAALRVAVDRELVSQFTTMEVLATDASLDAGKLDAFDDRARRAVAAHDEWLNVALLDPRSHVIVASAQPLPTPAPTTLAPTIADEVVRTRQPAIAGVFVSGRVTKKPVVLLMSPVLRGDEVRYVLSVTMDPQPLSDVFRRQQLAASWTGAVIDRRMRLAGRSRDAERFIGAQATPSLVERIGAADSGMFTALNQEGDSVYTVFSRSPTTGWSVAIGVPADEIEGPIRLLLLQLAGAGAALIAFALILAAVVGKSIVRREGEYERAEQRVRENEMKYRSLFETANDGIFLQDAKGFIDCNQRGADMYGLAKPDLIGRSPAELCPERQPDGRLSAEVAGEKIRAALQGEPQVFEWQPLRADGTLFDVEITLNRIRMGDAVCLQSIVRDISVRKQTERALQQSHDLLANLAAQVPGVIFQYRRFPDERVCVPYASDGLREMYELEPEQVREDASPALRLTHPDDDEGFIESMRISALTLLPWHHEYRVVLPKQGERWRLGSAQPEKLADGSILWHGFITDITERKAAEARDHLLVSALEAVGNGVVITDAQARIEWANPAFEALTGYAREEAVGRRPAELVKSGVQDQAYYETMWRTILDGALWRGELVNKRKDGSLYHEELAIAPVKNAAGEITHFVGVKQDISKRKRMEAELREMATTDTLTGLPNRRHFMDRLEEELARVLRLERQLAAVLMLDLDHFKQVNDTYGHVTGDCVLKHFAALLREGLRKIDTGGRIGGEEFAVILPGADMAAAQAFAERLRRKVAQTPVTHEGVTIPMTVSIGIAAIEAADASPDAALIRADEALYRAKEGGRNRVEVAV